MPIRWKMLILLLCISVVPVLVLRTMSQRAQSRLRLELAKQEEQTLIERSKAELQRMVEDHARLAGLEKSLLESLVLLQAGTIEKALRGPAPQEVPLQWAKMDGIAMGGRMGMQRRMASPGEEAKVLPRSMKGGGMVFMSGSARSALSDENAARLASSQAEIQAISRKHPGLFLRQITVFKDGLTSLMPGADQMPGRFQPVRELWFNRALASSTPVWGDAQPDPLDKDPVMVVAVQVRGPSSKPVGVTGIMAKVGTLLQKGRHLPSISARGRIFLIRPDRNNDLDVVAQEQGHTDSRHWMLPEAQENLISGDKEGLALITGDLKAHKSGVRGLDYQGEPSMWAYGPANWEGLALLMIVPRADLIAGAEAAREEVLKRLDEHIRFTGFLVIIVLAVVVVIALLASGTVTSRLKRMASAVGRLEKGDLETQVQIRGKDEIGSLGRAFNSMLPALRDRLRLKESLDLAQEVQTSLLPGRDLDLPGLKVVGVSRYCDQTGGDFFDFIPMGDEDESRYVVLAGDVTGHGAQAALLMATIRAFLRAELGKGIELASAMNEANRLLCKDTYGTGRFVTLFALQVDLPGRFLRWVKAGQHPALMTCGANQSDKELGGEGLPMGVDPDFEYRSSEMEIKDNYLLLISTDGLVEAEDQNLNMFGMQGLRTVMQNNPLAPPSKVLETVFSEVQRHLAGMPQKDDFTLIAARVENLS